MSCKHQRMLRAIGVTDAHTHAIWLDPIPRSTLICATATPTPETLHTSKKPAMEKISSKILLRTVLSCARGCSCLWASTGVSTSLFWTFFSVRGMAAMGSEAEGAREGVAFGVIEVSAKVGEDAPCDVDMLLMIRCEICRG